MKSFILLLFITIILKPVAGQPNKIATVENNLTEIRDFLFADSIVPRFNILDRMNYYKVPSVSIAVINNGKIEWEKAYGFKDIAAKIPADTNTLYQAASISKSVNGLVVMRLVNDGKLSLSTDIRNYLKTWTFPDNDLSRGKTITLINLLSHTAGLSVHGFVGYAVTDTIPTINQILDGKRPANNPPVVPVFSPGEHFEYSGGGSTVIRKILDDNISPDYDSLMQALVLKPLKMTHSTFSQPLAPEFKNFALAYDNRMLPVPGNFYIYPEQAAGGLWTTSGDIARFIMAIQSALRGERSAILDKKSVDKLLTPVLDEYALGFGIKEKGGEKYFWHEGESMGYRSVYYGSFTTGKGIVILTNSYPENGKSLVYEILNSVASTYNWKDFYNPPVKKLVNLPVSTLDKYVGDYYSDKPQMKISITRKNNSLELTARRAEPMFAVGTATFFLASSPDQNCIFSSSKNNGVYDTFEVKNGSEFILRATKK